MDNVFRFPSEKVRIHHFKADDDRAYDNYIPEIIDLEREKELLRNHVLLREMESSN